MGSPVSRTYIPNAAEQAAYLKLIEPLLSIKAPLLPDFTREQFDRCWNWLAAAIERSGPTHSKADVWAEIATGNAQLWPLPNGALVTQTRVWPTGFKEVSAWLAGGDLAEIADVAPMIERWAFEDEDADRVLIVARPGWLRALTGWKQQSLMIVKDRHGQPNS